MDSLQRRRPFDLIILLSSWSYSFVIIIIISTRWVWIHCSSAYTHYLVVILPFELIFHFFQIISILHLVFSFDRLSSILHSYTSKFFYWTNANRFLFFSYTRHSISLWMISVIWYVFTLVNLFKNKPSYLRFNYAIGLVQMSKFPVNHSVWSSVWTTMMLCNIWKSSRTFDQTSLRVVH